MKQLSFVFLVSLTLFTSLKLQGQEDRKVRLGLALNPNLGWLKPDNSGYSNEGIRAGFQYGLVADFRLFGDPNYSFSTGFTIAHLGGKLAYNDAVTNPATALEIPATTKATYKLNYIDVPLAIKLRSNEIGYMHFYGLFGTEVGFRINANADLETTSALGKVSLNDESIVDDIALFRADLVIGGGVEYTISGDTRLVAGIIYHNGLTNVLKGDALLENNGTTVIDANGKSSNDNELRNRLNYVALRLGIMF